MRLKMAKKQERQKKEAGAAKLQQSRLSKK